MTSFGKLLHPFVGLIFLFSVLAMVGCETGLQDRLTMVENDLSATQSELSTVQRELSDTETDLIGIQFDLSDCRSTPAGFGSLKIVNNNSFYSIYEVYISPITSDVWGSDWLQEHGLIIFSDTSKQFPVAPGEYDVLVVFSEGTEFEEQVTIQSGKETLLRYF